MDSIRGRSKYKRWRTYKHSTLSSVTQVQCDNQILAQRWNKAVIGEPAQQLLVLVSNLHQESWKGKKPRVELSSSMTNKSLEVDASDSRFFPQMSIYGGSDNRIAISRLLFRSRFYVLRLIPLFWRDTNSAMLTERLGQPLEEDSFIALHTCPDISWYSVCCWYQMV